MKTEQEFYNSLNDIDKDYTLLGMVVCAISGAIIGFILGYGLEWLVG